jgi:addiction module HigA family antidote
MIKRKDLDKIDFSDVGTGAVLPLITPGEILRTEFMAPFGVSGRALARDLGVPANRISEILNGVRGVTAETALLLAARFGTTAELWMNLQTAHDLEKARAKKLAVA